MDLHDLASSLQLDLPTNLAASLEQQGIRTLADIRASGGLESVVGLPDTDAARAAMHALVAHADLSALSTDLHTNAQLIDSGYTSPALIARTPRDRFVAELAPVMPETEAERIHAVALVRHQLLNHAIAGAIINPGDGGLPGDPQPLPARPCQCQDCQSAVSPGAYLTDLMDYALTHLQLCWPGFANPQAINLQYLIDLLYQPFDRLPLSCESTQEQVRQVRLCIEVLRKHLLGQTDLLSSNPAASYPIKFAFAGDVDGDGRDEVIVAPDWSATATEQPSRQASNALLVMDYDPTAKRWQHLSPIVGHPHEADVVCGPYPYAYSIGFAADVDGDGRDELVLAITSVGEICNEFWIMKYDPGTRQWRHLSQAAHPFNADLDPSSADVGIRLALAADVDGDQRAEIVIALDRTGAEGRLFWVMDYDPASQQWSHLSPIQGGTLDADLDPYSEDPASQLEAGFVIPGDFDGDGRAELAINLSDPSNSNTGRHFWALDYDPNARQWSHLRYSQGDVSGSAYSLPVAAQARFGASLDVDGDGRDELVVGVADDPSADPNMLWVADRYFDSQTGEWLWSDAFSIDCSSQPTHAQAAIVINSDGVEPREIAILPIFEFSSPDRNNPKNGLWIMQRDAASGQWRHQAAIANHPLKADLDWSATTNPVQAMFRADVDGDGRDEIVIYPAPRQSLWVMRYDAGASAWQHLSPVVDLAQAERQYLWAAYRALLGQLGTSFEEIRLARTAEDTEREALAERLGIRLPAARPDYLDELLLDQNTLTEARLEALFGLVDTTRDPFAPTPEPKLQQWRLSHLRATWLEQDGLTDAYSRHDLPVIDPDTVTPNDLRVFEPSTAGSPAALWLKRRQWIDARLRALRAKTKNVVIAGQAIAAPDLDAMLNTLRQDPIAYDAQQQITWSTLGTIGELDTLYDDITGQDKAKADTARTFIEDQLRLTPDSFSRLKAIREKDRAWALDPKQPVVTSSEWEEVYSILAQASKLCFYPAWIAEEGSWENPPGQPQRQLLSPKHFWPALREPGEGRWSPAIETPYIDPELVTLNDLPDPSLATVPVELWQQRRAKLNSSNEALQREYKINGLAGLLGLAFGAPPTGQSWAEKLKQLKDDLDSGTPMRSDPAQQFVAQQLFLTGEQFSRLVNLKAKLDGNRTPTRLEWIEADRLLTTALKLRTLYPAWNLEETGKGLSYWSALKARLPRWRTTPAARQAWLQALAARSRSPIIDTDVITLGHVRADATSAQQIYSQRQAAISAYHDLLRNATRDLAGFRAMLLLDDSLGLTDTLLDALIEQREAGDSVARRLDQLGITAVAFAFLSRIYRLLKKNQQVLDDEWEAVSGILTQVWKRRQYADWRAQESVAGLTNSPAFFQLPARDPVFFPAPQQPEVSAWRSARADLRDWTETLQSRIDQNASIKDGLRNLVGSVEQAVLPLLRNALILASNVPLAGNKAKWLSERLLIDTQVDGCQLTTRAAQAIETLQALLWSARTGQLDGLELQLYAPDFDDEWRWIGSYATWRAAMFVYLYPENILQPSLRRRQTPAFRGLLNELRASRNLSTRSAREAAENYATYFQDLIGLIPEAGTLAYTPIYEESYRSPVGSMHQLAFLFATGRASGKVYWSTLDIQASSPEYAQSFWEPLDGIKKQVVRLVGAVVYTPTPKQRYLYLFTQTQELGQPSLGFVRYDLDSGRWDNEVTPLELPDQTRQFTAWVRRSTNESSPPSLAIQLSQQVIYTRQLNLKGSDWSSDEFVRLPVQGVWQRLTDGASRPNTTDLTAGSDPTMPVRYLLAADVDQDGRDELIVGIGLDGGPGSGAWVLKYNNQNWASLPTIAFPGSNLSAAFAVSGDFDGDGRIEIAAAANPVDDPRYGNHLWAMRYDGSNWNSLGAIQNNPIGASIVAGASSLGWVREAPVKFAVVGDFDGQRRDEIMFALADRIENYHFFTDSFNAFVVMDYENGQWMNTKHRPDNLSFLDQTLDVSFRCSPEQIKANFAVAGDFDGDGRDEVAIAASARTNNASEGNDFWVMDFRNNTWAPLGAPSGGLGTAFDLSAGGETAAFAVAGDFDGDGRAEIAIAPFVSSGASTLWIMKYHPGPYADPALDGSWQAMTSLDLGAAPFNAATPAVFAVAGDFNGDGQDELAIIANFNTDTRGNDLWIAHYDKPSSSWMALPTLDCAPENLAAAFAVAGRFEGVPGGQGRAEQLAIAPGTVSAAVLLSTVGEAIPNVFATYQGAAEGNQLWVRGFSEVADARQPYYAFANVAPFYNGALPKHNIPLASIINMRRKYSEEAWKANVATRRTNLIYIEEYFYAVPIAIALQLQRSGEYAAALDWFRLVYDYTALPDQRKIYYGLRWEEQIQTPDYSERAADWLLDPLDPHLIAGTRRNTHSRFVLLSLIDCFLDYADAEFTRDTAESIARARILYTTALELLDLPELRQGDNQCQVLIGWIEKTFDFWHQVPVSLIPAATRLIADLRATNDVPVLEAVLAEARALRAQATPWETALPRLQDLLARQQLAQAAQPTPTLAHILAERPLEIVRAQRTALAQPSLGRELALLGQPSGALPLSRWVPTISYAFCVAPNPVPNTLQLRAELNLYKIRTCRNIAGMERQFEPYSAPTDTRSGLPLIGAGGQLILPGTTILQPTPYRYAILIERAKQLVSMAQQVESAMLLALQQRDQEAYSLLKARQDLRLARAGVQLQDLRVKEAESGVKLAELQKQRSEILSETYQEWIDAGLIQLEQAMIGWYGWLAGYQMISIGAQAALTGMSVPAIMATTWYGQLAWQGTNAIKAAADQLAVLAQANINVLGIKVGFERRKQEWELQKKLADQDILIGTQQIRIAEDHVRVVGQERVIAGLGADNAEATLDFLNTKFTGVELYDWMSGVLEGVYRFFLQQATSIAQLASNQLAFERHETPPPFIQSDYWQPPSQDGSSTDVGGRNPDRRGLTGSARLLQDIYQLDQYAFETNKRKLQLSKTISLAQLSPVEFLRFRETGILRFATPMDMFDNDFPGHYLRLIHKVRVSVIALVPPNQGIRAMLTGSGLSRVVIGGDLFQTVLVRREPQTIALSSPLNATGLFELDPQSDMLAPFEATGVDTSWELRMPKAANRFDYGTIADVLLTIEYTALNSFDYRQQIIQQLDTSVRAEQAFSFRNQFADQWYDLHNPDSLEEPQQMVASFSTTTQDFPPNLESLKIQHVALFFARKNGSTFELPVTSLYFTQEGSASAVGGPATPIEGVISTRNGNAVSWMTMIGKAPFGNWVLTLANSEEMQNRLKNQEIDDILFVITYSGRTPEWPG